MFPIYLIMSGDEFRILPMKKLRVWSKVNVRKTDKYIGIEDLKNNILEIGIQMPLVVTPHKKNYRIISGQRRFIAAGKAKLNKIPCRIIKNVSEQDGVIMSLSENLYREDMTDGDKADAVEFLKKKMGSVELVAKAMGISVVSVYNYLSWKKIFPRLQKLANEKKITNTVARAIQKKYPNDESFAYTLAMNYSRRGVNKSNYYAAIKDAHPNDDLEDINRKFKKIKITDQYTIRLPKSSSKVIKELSKETKHSEQFVIVALVEQSLSLVKSGKVEI